MFRATYDAERIGTLAQFVDSMSKLQKRPGHLYAYRGHASTEFLLKPSIFRSVAHATAEYDMFRELYTLQPSEFSGDTTTFDHLVRMQHFSLPTRLLDVTYSPLVALYFACIDAGDEKEDGEVYWFEIPPDSIKYYDSDIVTLLANLSNISPAQKQSLARKYKDEDLGSDPAAIQLHHFIKREKPYFELAFTPEDLRKIVFVKAKQSNKRIISQNGAFLLFGLLDLLHGSNVDSMNVYSIRIRRTAKKRILKELDNFNINERFLFPDIETASIYVREKYKDTSLPLA